MLNWLKKKARIPFQSRYNNLRRSPNQSNMIINEDSNMDLEEPQASTSDVDMQFIRIFIHNNDGEEYSLDVSPQMTIEQLKTMALAHFHSPAATFGNCSNLNQNWSEPVISLRPYRIILARESRSLPDSSTVHLENLEDDDDLLLIKNHESQSSTQVGGPPTAEAIASLTSSLAPKNFGGINKEEITYNFTGTFFRVMLTLIEISVNLISAQEDSIDSFIKIFEELGKKSPKVDKSSLKKLTEMGFSESRATKALHVNRNNVEESMDWLLDDSNCDESGLECVILSLSREKKKEFFLFNNRDISEVVIKEFHNYWKRWFEPNMDAVKILKNLDYGEDVAKEALRAAHNNLEAARLLLEGDSSLVDSLQMGYNRDHPMMIPFLESPIVHMHLSKPKVLYALMVLVETPANLQIWLNDPDTAKAINVIYRIYNTEKHILATSISS